MSFLKGGVIAEIGVADGCFSDFFCPSCDQGNLLPLISSQCTNFVRAGMDELTCFRIMTQLEYYMRKFADRGPQVVIE